MLACWPGNRLMVTNGGAVIPAKALSWNFKHFIEQSRGGGWGTLRGNDMRARPARCTPRTPTCSTPD